MGKKYIIEIEDGKEGIILCQKGIVTVGLRLENESELKPLGIQSAIPYTEPDLEQVRKEAYQKGYETGYEDGYNEPGKNQQETYQRGLADAWEAASEIAVIPYDEVEKIFGATGWHIFMKFTASEVIEKIKAWEEKKQNEIKVGDEVESTFGKGVVVKVEKAHIGYIYEDGSWGFNPPAEVSKTGRHFPEIAAILEKMRGDGNQNRIQETMSDDY